MKDLYGIHLAHRGLYDHSIFENTLSAFSKAIENHFPIELDVHLLKDHKIVVFHDDDLNRIFGVNVKLKDCTYEDLKQYIFPGTTETIPLLEDVLKLVNGKVLLDIELKYDQPVGILEEELVKFLDSYSGPFLVKSFQPFTVRWFYKHRPNYIRGLLVGISNLNPIVRYVLEHVLLFSYVHPQFLACEKKLVTTRRIQKLKKKVPILVWVIRNDELKYQNYADGFIFER